MILRLMLCSELQSIIWHHMKNYSQVEQTHLRSDNMLRPSWMKDPARTDSSLLRHGCSKCPGHQKPWQRDLYSLTS